MSSEAAISMNPSCLLKAVIAYFLLACSGFAQVSTPQFSPEGGMYGAYIQVAITCDTAGAEIHYTTNGADPTTDDPVLGSGETVRIGANLTLKARAWAGGEVSPAHVQQYWVQGAIAGGQAHSLALMFDRSTVWSFGVDYAGQLAHGVVSSLTGGPMLTGTSGTASPKISNVIGIGAGKGHSLVILGDRFVMASGWNLYGQLGNGNTTDQYTLVSVLSGMTDAQSGQPGDGQPLDNVVAVEGSGYSSYAIRENNGLYEIWSWGQGSSYQLGQGNSTQSQTKARPVRVSGTSGPIFSGSDIRAISAADRYAMALKSGTIFTWGNNQYGQLATGTTLGYIKNPLAISGTLFKDTAGNPQEIVGIGTSDSTGAAITADGAVWCWGYNAYGQVGSGTTGGNILVPAKVKTSGTSFLSNINAVAGGVNHFVALSSDGSVWTWGYGSTGQLGDGTVNVNSNIAVRVKISATQSLSNVVQIAVEDNSAIALTADGLVYGWGSNSSKCLGILNDSNTKYYATLANALPKLANESPTVALSVDRNPWLSGTTLTLSAAVADLDGGSTIDRVDFYFGDQFVGESIQAPWTLQLSSYSPYGTYQVHATVYDENGASGTSNSISLEVRQSFDDWSLQYFQQTGIDPNADPDGDGLSNQQEYDGISDPTDYYNGILPTLAVVEGNNQTGRPGEILSGTIAVAVTSGTKVCDNAPISLVFTSGTGTLRSASDWTILPSPELLTGTDGVVRFMLELPGNPTAAVSVSAIATSGTNISSAIVTVLDIMPSVAMAATANSNPIMTGTMTTLNVLGADELGEGGLTYVWSATGPGTVNFSINGNNAAKNSIASFSQAGTYMLMATITDSGALAVTSTVGVTVYQDLSGFGVIPGSTTLPLAGTQQFMVTGTDQFGNAPSDVIWTVEGVGQISSDGVFTSGTIAGASTVTARSGTSVATSTVTVVNLAPSVSTPASASPVTSGTSTTLSVLGSDELGETDLTYAWTAIGPGSVIFTDNNSNSAKTATVIFSEAGDYALVATITDSGSLVVSSTVNVSIQQNLSNFAVAPNSVVLPLSGTQQFSVTGSDQFGHGPANVIWSVSGLGTVTSDGLFTSEMVSGTSTITATSGTSVATATVLTELAVPVIQSSPTFSRESFDLTVDHPDPNAQLHYRLDGSEPVAEDPWIAPGATVKIEGPSILTVKAFRGAVSSAMASGTYIVGQAVFAGDYHTIVLSCSRKGFGWGQNSTGQAGSAPVAELALPAEMQGVSGLVAVAAGSDHGTGLLADGTFAAWGANDAGQLGRGDRIDVTGVQATALAVGGKLVAAGGNHSAVIDVNGVVFGAGRNRFGEVGTSGSADVLSFLPASVSGTFKAIQSRAHYTLAIASDGAVLGWGDSTYGQLGEYAERVAPKVILSSTYGAVQIAAGRDHALALTSDGTVLAWGANWSQQLGDDSGVGSASPTPVPGLPSGVIEIAAGGGFSMALTADGRVWMWGARPGSQSGECGTVSEVLNSGSNGFTNARRIACGMDHGIVLTEDGNVWTFGANEFGQLGDGSVVSRTSPGLSPAFNLIPAGQP